MKSTILFVDDNENILQGLRRNLRPMHQEWDCKFAVGGEAALALMENTPVDVIVTDMRMPGMDGAEFLRLAKERHGHAVRFVLSGQCEEEVILRLLGVSHQYMAKPFDTGKMIEVIRGVLEAKRQVGSEGLKSFIARLSKLPALPELHDAVLGELQAQAPSTKALEDLFLRDIGFLAKLFQIVNSSYFGPTQDINTIAYIWELLSLEKIKALVLQEYIVARESEAFEQDPFIRLLWTQSLLTARIARGIAKAEDLPFKVADKVFVAGMLHMIGALATYLFMRGEGRAGDAAILAPDAEDHYAKVGGFLLTLWGLPRDICYTVRNHHNPVRCETGCNDSILAMVHVAWALAWERTDPSRAADAVLNAEFLRQTGVFEKLEDWKIAAATV